MQTGTVPDIEKCLLTVQIQDWRGTEFQKYKVRNDECLLQIFSAFIYLLVQAKY